MKKYKEIIMYLIFGVATTAVNWVVYTLLVTLMKAEVTFSNAVAWFVAVVFAYVTNKLFVFESRDTSIKTLVKEILAFFGSRVASGVIEIFLPTLLMAIGLNQAVFGIEGSVAKFAVSAIVIILNYIFSKLIVFRSKK